VLGRTPEEASSTFAMFTLSSGIKLGPSSRDEVAPGGRRRGRQRRACAHCRMPTRCGLRTQTGAARKLKIAQPPTKLDFGSTFVALLDPDGHHLRVFAPPVP
jgi:hypothetical protein